MNTSKPVNILLTSAGRRVQLVRFFQRALARSGLSAKVLVSEANPEWSAAARVADGSIHVPPVQAPDTAAITGFGQSSIADRTRSMRVS